MDINRAPQHREAEQSVLGSMLSEPKRIPDVIGRLKSEDFEGKLNADIFETIVSMFSAGEPVDYVTVAAKTRETGGGDVSEYVARLVDTTPTATNVMAYADIVLDRAVTRRLEQAATEILEHSRAGTSAEQLLDFAEQRIYDIRGGKREDEMKPLGRVIADAFQYLRTVSDAKGKLRGLPTGIRELDDTIGGLMPSNLILIASRPGMGKTSFALNLALKAVRGGEFSAAFFSLEMSLHQLGLRILSSEGPIESSKFLSGNLSAEEWRIIAETSADLSGLKIMFGESAAITVAEMKAKCRRIKNLGLIVIDYLQLMQSPKRSDNRVQEVSEISRSLKIMAKELDVPVVCLSQLSRANESRADKRPMLSDLRESGAIEQDADVVMFLYRDDYYNEDSDKRGIAECIIAKNRHGGTRKLELAWAGEYTTFTALETNKTKY